MKWIDSSYEILEQGPGIDGMYEQIERCGRLCYKSLGTSYFSIPTPLGASMMGYESEKIGGIAVLLLKIKQYADEHPERMEVNERKYMVYVSMMAKWKKDWSGELDEWESEKKYGHTNITAKSFVEDVLKKNGHGAMLEHGTVPLVIPGWRLVTSFRYIFNKYSRLKFKEGCWMITTNYRVITEKNREKDMKYFEWTPYHYRRPCVKFTMDRVGSQSVERHRGKYGISFAQESTRFCNYGGGKFGHECTFVIPRWMYNLNTSDKTGAEMVDWLAWNNKKVQTYVNNCQMAESSYMSLLDNTDGDGLKPEDARGVLPLNIKTEFAMTAFGVDWDHFFELRADSHAHPDIQYIARQLEKEPVFE